MGNKVRQVVRGEIYLADLPIDEEHAIQGGTRPFLIIQNNTGNRYSPTTIGVAITSQDKKKGQATHVSIKPDEQNGLKKDSMVLCEQIMSIDKNFLRKRRLGRVSDSDLIRIDRAIVASLALKKEPKITSGTLTPLPATEIAKMIELHKSSPNDILCIENAEIYIATPESVLKNITFKNCLIDGISFNKSRVQNVTFDRCLIKCADFQETKATMLSFINCNLISPNFTGSEITKLFIEGSIFENPVFANNYAGAIIAETSSFVRPVIISSNMMSDTTKGIQVITPIVSESETFLQNL